MVTLAELRYVSSYPNKIPYPGEDYALDVFSKVRKCYEEYNEFYRNRGYTITLSDNSELEFQIFEKNLCHLLGIDFKNIMQSFYQKQFRNSILGLSDDVRTSSYNMLETILEKVDKVIEFDSSINGKVFNYYKLGVKADIFLKLYNLENSNFGCISLNKDLNNNMSPLNRFNSQKLLYFPSDEILSPYSMMGIISNDSSDEGIKIYSPETTFLPTNHVDFFGGNPVAIPTQILTTIAGESLSLNKKIASPEQKIALINDYNSLIQSNDLPNALDISGDYVGLLKQLVKNNSRK